jgi:hypothetical protein
MATIAGAMLSSASWVKALNVPYVDVAASPAMWNTSAARNVMPAKARTFARHGAIASAKSPFNLRKLTMSDFGDVEDHR